MTLLKLIFQPSRWNTTFRHADNSKWVKHYPAVLLVQGTGPHDRNEEILGHRPFEVIADYLTRKGIAVLRVDRRGCGKSEGKYVNLDIDHYVEDALSAIEFLRSCPNVDTSMIGIIGHSLGGFIAAIASSRTSSVSFIISCVVREFGEKISDILSISCGQNVRSETRRL